MNKVYLSGRLSADPNVMVTKNDKMFATATIIANNRGYKTYMNIKGFGDIAESFGELRKDDYIFVAGSLNVDAVTKDGEDKKTYYTNVVVDDIELLSMVDEDEIPS